MIYLVLYVYTSIFGLMGLDAGTTYTYRSTPFENIQDCKDKLQEMRVEMLKAVDYPQPVEGQDFDLACEQRDGNAQSK